MSENRILLAEELLREVVYRSRDRQAAVQSLRMNAGAGVGNCGLGERAEVALDLSARGREIFDQLFDPGFGEPELGKVRTLMTGWIERQDSIDRKRNHFLKEFRARHGFDRERYAMDVLAAFETGLARIGSEEDAARRSSAEQLLSSGS